MIPADPKREGSAVELVGEDAEDGGEESEDVGSARLLILLCLLGFFTFT